MIIHMIPGTSPNDKSVQAICAKAARYGIIAEVKTMQGTHHQTAEVHLKDGAAVLCSSLPTYPFETMPGVDRVVRVSPSLISLAMNGVHEPHLVQIGKSLVGAGQPCLPVLGPCAIDKRIGQLVERLVYQGVRHVRGGFVKPRSQAGSFRGFGQVALGSLLAAAKQNGIESVWTEVMDSSNIDEVRRQRDATGYQGDIVLWVGARTSNQILLERLGQQDEFQIMLKNNIRAQDTKEMFTAAEFILHGDMSWNEDGTLNSDHSRAAGNHNLILCIRGLEKTDPHSPLRFYPNYDWIDALHQRAWAPVCFDPSHIAGQRQYVAPVLAEGLKHNPDAVLIETHIDPEKALCDPDQAVPVDQLPEILAMIDEHNQTLGRVEEPV
jgi:3-deoxy-7-phosphoheptulonate synthase